MTIDSCEGDQDAPVFYYCNDFPSFQGPGPAESLWLYLPNAPGTQLFLGASVAPTIIQADITCHPDSWNNQASGHPQEQIATQRPEWPSHHAPCSHASRGSHPPRTEPQALWPHAGASAI